MPMIKCAGCEEKGDESCGFCGGRGFVASSLAGLVMALSINGFPTIHMTELERASFLTEAVREDWLSQNLRDDEKRDLGEVLAKMRKYLKQSRDLAKAHVSREVAKA